MSTRDTTAVSASLQDQIRGRFQAGFEEWNKGYESWLKWCDTLYEPNAHYNVYTNRLDRQQASSSWPMRSNSANSTT